MGREVVFSSLKLQKIPEIAVQISKDGHRAVAHPLRFADEDHAIGLVRLEVPSELIGVQEQEDAASGLVADARRLLRPDRAGEQHLRLGRAGLGDQDPASVPDLD